MEIVTEIKKPVCKFCGKEYLENPNIPANFPEFLKLAMAYIPTCDCFEKEEQRLKEEQEKQRMRECLENKIKKYRDISIIDKKFLDSKFENAIEDVNITFAKKYTKKFLTTENVTTGLYFYGDVGTGKTFTTSCICNSLMKHGKTVLIMNLGLYLIKIFREWAEAENDVLNYVKTCDLLVIDDLGTENIKDFAREKVFNLIDTRYRANKPMIITSNIKLEDVKTVYSPRIYDRIQEMCYEYTFIGESKRKIDKDKFLEWLAG